MEFKAFPEIKRINKVEMSITQKIHGTNAQIFIVPIPDDIAQASEWMIKGTYPEVEIDGKYFAIFAGSRTRWITPEDDNFGFASFVMQNKQEIVEKLGEGQHFGEWAGPGINSGEGLSEKTFVLFDHRRFPEGRPLPPRTVVVPVLYQGPLSLEAIDQAMLDLKTNGSKLAPGFMRPEGVVAHIMGTRYKKVFDAEETQWTKPKEAKTQNPKKPSINVDHLLQPIRLEKLLSRDQVYLVAYPDTLPQICKDYTEDLIKEEQITGTEDEIKAIRKALGSEIFGFVKHEVRRMTGM